MYQHLFADRDFDLYEENGKWEEQRKKLDLRRVTAILKIFQQDGVLGVINFAESVFSSFQVGYAVGDIADDVLEKFLLPKSLDSLNGKHKALVGGFIWRRHNLKGWGWSDVIDKSAWTSRQIGQFLACLPFTKEALDRASKWLQNEESEYWNLTGANAYQAYDELGVAIDMLVEYGKPHAAISCLDKMRHDKQLIDTNQCVRALLAAISSKESNNDIDGYHIVELIKFLQIEPSVDHNELFKVEWAYLPLLDHHQEATPKLLESRLANDPEFFSRSNPVDLSLQKGKSTDEGIHRGIKGNSNKRLATAS